MERVSREKLHVRVDIGLTRREKANSIAGWLKTSEDKMQGIGAFERKFHVVGRLQGTNIINGAEFVRPDQVDFLAYCGNRVNLYILDYIDRTNFGTQKIGIQVGWRFLGRAQPNTPFISYREQDGAITTFLQIDFEEPKMVFSNLATDAQVADLQANLFQMPNNVYNYYSKFKVLPLVARADFMKVRFWADPGTFVGKPGDDIYIVAMAGSDVAGSQKL